MLRTLVFTAISVACANASAAYPVTVNSCNRTVNFDEPPKAAVSSDVNLTEMMLVLRLEDHMAGIAGVGGRDRFEKSLQQAAESLPLLSPRYPTKEILLSAGADFYFSGWNYGLTLGGEISPESLEPFGIAVYELTESCIHVGPRSGTSIEDLYTDLLNLGTIFGVRDRAEKLVAGYRSEMAEIKEKQAQTAPLRVFVYDSGERTPFTAGKYAMPTAMIEAAGGRNVMDDLEKSWATIAWEAVVEKDPEFVVIINYGEVTAEQKRMFMVSNPALAGIDAVVNDRFVVLEYVEATPGPRNIQATMKLAEAFQEY